MSRLLIILRGPGVSGLSTEWFCSDGYCNFNDRLCSNAAKTSTYGGLVRVGFHGLEGPVIDHRLCCCGPQIQLTKVFILPP